MRVYGSPCNCARQGHTFYLLREDVLKLDRYIAKATLLIDNKIETVSDLQAYCEGLQASIAQLTAERQDLRNALKRADCTKDEPAQQDCTEQIKQTSASIRKVRKEVKLCNEIEANSTMVSEKLRRSTKALNKEKLQRQVNLSERRVQLTTLR